MTMRIPEGVDTRGCVVLPGGVDPHAHPLANIEAATAAAARGGTTTVLAFTAPRPGESATVAFERARDELVPRAAVDVRLHPSIWEPERLDRTELERLRAAGARSVKLFTAFPELGMVASDRKLYETLRDAARLELLVMVHCEVSGAIDALVDEALAGERTGARSFAETRPPLVEEAQVARVLDLARLAAAPVYLVHLSTAGSLELVRAARRRGQTVWAEACTHYLVLDESRYDGDDAERFLVAPPLRSRGDVDALWEGVADGTVDTVGSDHAESQYRPDFPPGDFRSLPYGYRGIEVRVPVVLSEGARRGIPYERLADVLARAPARAFGVEPDDGDALVWDPEPEWTIRDGSPFDGLPVTGRIRHVLRRGVPVG
jgi:dihydropyrimidinase